uniref:ABC transporter permease subunit n=1 Tax=Ningiella ruwaisensis TaxID=2364274 RepID=UPI0010A00DBF|nr:ABC transporter permease subunit [Ningiella ruwaisensis]
MQHNLQESIDIKRFRKDAVARHVFRFFGLLVLALFLLLIIHIFSNAFPLLKTPELELKQSLDTISFEDIDHQAQMGDGLLLFNYRRQALQTVSATNSGDAQQALQCSVTVYEISEQTVSSAQNAELSHVKNAQFFHPCSQQFIGVDVNEGYLAYYAMLHSNGMLELFSLSNLNAKIERELVASFTFNNEMQGQVQREGSAQNALQAMAVNPLLDKADWHMIKAGDHIAMYQKLSSSSIALFFHHLASIEAPSIQVIRDVEEFKLLPRMQLIAAIQNEQALILSPKGEIKQTLSENLDNALPKHILASPSERSLYLSVGNEVYVYRNANIDGAFLYTSAGTLSLDKSDAFKQIKFDRQTLAAFALDRQGIISIINSASNEEVSYLQVDEPVLDMLWHNRHLYLFSADKIFIYQLNNRVGITTFASLFEPLQYEGYSAPNYIWQTSQSAEFAEAKFSLIPLIIGSLKASFLALIVAIPLALGAAIYTAYFAPERIRNIVKPSIEMIEAIPSVIIGFVAAVWLAPFAERSLLSILIVIICTPFIVLLLAILSNWMRQQDKYANFEVYHLLSMSILFILSLLIVFHSSQYIQLLIMDQTSDSLGGFSSVISNLVITKTTVVVALALGIAVAPTIYSLVDDALFDVPEGVKQASFALGASQMQTLTKVVLVVASPSIISAIMLGLGRAFGETMIVLMVTGNTPIADWDLLSGLRSLTSNLTIELQEASRGTSQYHILFLTAAILFAFTFVVNTVAALLKKRYQTGESNA